MGMLAPMDTGSDLMVGPHSTGRTERRASHAGIAHDLLRDWRRWSRGERIAAAFMLAAVLAGASALILSTLAAAAT